MAGAWSAFAQVPQVDQSQLYNPPPGEQTGPSENRPNSDFTTGAAPSSPGDRDLGEQVILKRQTKSTPFIFTLDASINYTSNVALVDRGALGDAFFLTQAALTYQYKLRDNLIIDAGVSEGIFRYDKYTVFDFNSFNIGLGATYVFKGVAFSARYNFNQLSDSDFHPFFDQNSITLGAQKTISINSAFFTYFGATARINFNSPVITQRDEYNLYLCARAALSRSFTLDAFYRGGLFNYTNQSRNDFNQTFGVSLRYAPRPWIVATASTSFGWNLSSQNFFSYRVGNAGLNLGVVLKF
jgi:hypothetical protein